jgi:ubiquinone/menaquinone biosynthesis C-methylase UbiE
MIPRTLEPETMDDREEVREYRQMDHGLVNQKFVEDLVAGGPVGPKVMDLGCGTAEIPILLCQTRDEIEMLGVDASIEMLEAARLEIDVAGMLGRIHLEHADCKTLEGFAGATADTVISNTVLHHLSEPKLLIEQALRVLAPGGRIFCRDLIRPADAGAVEALVEQHAGSESAFAQQLLRQSLHAALTLKEMRSLVADLGIQENSVEMTSDRHWTLDWTTRV